MASPRRSNRGGHTKGRKKEEDDDGGQTRCVCNQQHHEGVMIQCETCKVWQHCPCVGLGNGEVTPDKYYCDSCRPENHPYRVVQGQLVTNATSSSSTQKPTKKRSTMNSKEASIPMDLMLAQQKWNEEHQDELEDEYAQRQASKRRRKTESNSTDINDDSNLQDRLTKEAISAGSTAGAVASPSDKKKDKSGCIMGLRQGSSSSSATVPTFGTSGSSHSSSSKSSSSGRTVSKKTSTKATSKARSRSNSPLSNGVPDLKNGRPVVVDSSSTADGVPSKRRKTSSRSDTAPLFDLAPSDDSVTKENHSDAAHRPRKIGCTSSKPSHKRSNNSLSIMDGDNDLRDGSETPSSHSHQQVPSVSSPATSAKKSFSKRGDRGHGKNGSRPSTPTPARECTPQLLVPAAPATVRYPSSKMTMQEMSKRAKQLLDYISRVQIDMADRKNKSGTLSPPECSPPSVPQQYAQHRGDTKPARIKTFKSVGGDESLFRLPASASVAMYSDSQVCPDLSRTSMESAISSIDGLHEPSSPIDTKVPSKEMTIKVVPMDAHSDAHPLLSTPPLSVHDHQHHRHHRLDSGTPESDATHEPLTPPHHPADGPEEHGPGIEEGDSKTGLVTTTSFDLMDKLTGDLIRFQEKFGAFA